MSYNYTLRYRTFETLIASAKSDFRKYDLNDSISDIDLVKVAQRVNYDLGLRIQQTKEIVLEVEKGRVRLPNNFYILNFMLLCGKYETKQYLPQGTHIEERIVEKGAPEYQVAPPPIATNCSPDEIILSTPCDPCNTCGNPCCENNCNCTCNNVETAVDTCELNCKGEKTYLVQTLRFETRMFETLEPIKLLDNAMAIDCDCPNLYWDSPFTGWIKDGWLYLNFQTGNLYLNYQGMMEDDDGNLLVVDHDMINEYYEYAIKQRILENLIMNDIPVTQNKIQLIEERYRVARNNALSIVRTPNFAEMQKTWKMNRKAQYNKYYNMFMSYPISNRR